MIKSLFLYFFNLFNTHPNKSGMSYFRHMLLSLKFSLLLFCSAIKALLHALFPFMFKTSTTDVVSKINKMLVASGCKKKDKEKDKTTYNFAV